jgi:NADH:ubiquinone oxidoreductase subunit F (NADH-binding)
MVAPVRVLTAGIGELNLRDIDVYRSQGGYAQWERAVRELSPAEVADVVMKANLRGRGGAGFPTTGANATSSATATKRSPVRSRTTCCSRRRLTK